MVVNAIDPQPASFPAIRAQAPSTSPCQACIRPWARSTPERGTATKPTKPRPSAAGRALLLHVLAAKGKLKVRRDADGEPHYDEKELAAILEKLR